MEPKITFLFELKLNAHQRGILITDAQTNVLILKYVDYVLQKYLRICHVINGVRFVCEITLSESMCILDDCLLVWSILSFGH